MLGSVGIYTRALAVLSQRGLIYPILRAEWSSLCLNTSFENGGLSKNCCLYPTDGPRRGTKLQLGWPIFEIIRNSSGTTARVSNPINNPNLQARTGRNVGGRLQTAKNVTI